MIVVMQATKLKLNAKENIVNAPNLNSDVTMVNVFHQDGVVTTKTTVEIIQMKLVARIINAKMEHSNVLLVIALLHISVVMVIEIVAICQMKQIVHHDSQAADIVQSLASNAQIICVLQCQIFAMALTTVAITQTKHLRFVQTSIVTRCVDSNVQIIVVLLDIKYAMVSIIVVTVVMKTT